MSRAHLIPILLTALAVASCADVNAPRANLTGEWSTLPVPSGGGTSMSLAMSGSTIIGKGANYGLQGQFDDSINVSGTVHGSDISLTITDYGSTTSHPPFAGHIVSSHEFNGAFTAVSTSFETVTFLRQ